MSSYMWEAGFEGRAIRVEASPYGLRHERTLFVDGKARSSSAVFFKAAPLIAQQKSAHGVDVIEARVRLSRAPWAPASDLCILTVNGTAVPVRVTRAPLFLWLAPGVRVSLFALVVIVAGFSEDLGIPELWLKLLAIGFSLVGWISWSRPTVSDRSHHDD